MNKQNGFTAVEILIVIVLIGVVSGLSVFAYSRIQGSDDTKKSVATEKQQDATNESETEHVYEPADKMYKISLPDGWRFTYTPASSETENVSYLYAATKDMELSPGVKAQVKDQVGGYGGETGFTLSVHKHDGPVGYGEGLKSLGSFKTSQGKTVNAFQDEEATEPFSEPSDSAGDFFSQYEYYLVGADNTVYKFVYNLSAGDTSHKDLVEKSIKSIQIP